MHADRFGWKAMPFALEDLDSNYLTVSICRTAYSHAAKGFGVNTLVNIPDEACILTTLEAAGGASRLGS